mmetsp:Transcript_10672/g.13852  ORF Transcript_10672/g.13852 Transcript_10672/m.13852 type:complete len:248 (-) Transcript_10672:205-948(-)
MNNFAEKYAHLRSEIERKACKSKEERNLRTHEVLSAFDKALANETVPSASPSKQKDPKLVAVVTLQCYCRKLLAKKIHVQKLLEKMERDEKEEQHKLRRFTMESLDMLDAINAAKKIQDLEILETEKRKKATRSASLIQSWYRWKSSGSILNNKSSILADVEDDDSNNFFYEEKQGESLGGPVITNDGNELTAKVLKQQEDGGSRAPFQIHVKQIKAISGDITEPTITKSDDEHSLYDVSDFSEDSS